MEPNISEISKTVKSTDKEYTITEMADNGVDNGAITNKTA
jgi:hypothetical protein